MFRRHVQRPLAPARSHILISGVLVLVCAQVGCSDPDADEGTELPATGGALSTGGSMGSGGLSSSGGQLGSGGSAAGGGTSSGGAPPAGGASSGGAGSGGAELGSGGDGSGGTENAGFSPCPASGPCKILPLGDSITFGLGFDGGYRVELFHLATSDGHDITFTGTQAKNGPNMVDGKPFPRGHEGISGQTIDQIAARVPNPALNEMPHIILLHAGTNDMFQNANGADMRLGNLIDKLVTEAPDALIAVSNIIPFPSAASATEAFNAKVPDLVQARADDGAHVIFVDQFEGFPTSELGDGVHPNETGYARMARTWYDAIETYLP